MAGITLLLVLPLYKRKHVSFEMVLHLINPGLNFLSVILN